MRVESYNSFAMSRNFSGKKIGGISVPDYNDFYFNTKTAPKMSDDKFTEAIVQQAQKDAAIGKAGVECPGFKSLMKSYVSVVSPDRKGMISNALTSLEHIKKLPKPEAISLLDILLGKRIMSADNELSYAEFKDSNGEVIATYSNGGWSFQSTKAEDARTSEFYGIYLDAWNAARSGAEDLPVSATRFGTMDVIV